MKSRDAASWIELPPGSPVISVAEEVLCAEWDGNLRLPDSANPDLIAQAALMILDCASGKANNNNRMPFVAPEECWYIGSIILELVRIGNKVNKLLAGTEQAFNPKKDKGIILNALTQHGYVITLPEKE